MERDTGRPWDSLTRFLKTSAYWAFILVLILNIVRISGICWRVRDEMLETQKTLECLQSQDRELIQKLKELEHEQGRDLELKKRLYVKKDERWILFEHEGQPIPPERLIAPPPGE